MTKRLLDILLATMAGLILLIPALLITLLIKLTSAGPALYWSDRVGRNNAIFAMPKFRSMKIDTPALATDKLGDPSRYLTPIGGLLRKTSLDEIPQLWCVIKGDMSFVGPRPALYNQDELIALRTALDVHHLTPGITGWAQINGRDTISDEAKAELDAEYAKRQSIGFDLRILWLTLVCVVRRSDIVH